MRGSAVHNGPGYHLFALYVQDLAFPFDWFDPFLFLREFIAEELGVVGVNRDAGFLNDAVAGRDDLGYTLCL